MAEETTKRRNRRPTGDDVAERGLFTPSGTAVAGEAMRTGVVPLTPHTPPPETPVLDADVQVGDPDVDLLSNTYVGDESPGGSTPTPDQDRVDDIGRACGVAEADSGALRASSEILDRRDQRRAQQDIPDPKPPE